MNISVLLRRSILLVGCAGLSALTGCGGTSSGNDVANIQQVNGFTSPLSVRASTSGNMLVTANGEVFVYGRIGEVYQLSFTLNGTNQGASAFVDPVDAVEDSNGTIYVLDAGTKSVDVFKNTSGSYKLTTSFGNSGPNQLSAAKSIAFDASGNVYILDTGSQGVQVWDLTNSTYLYSTLIQNSFKTPTSIAIANGNLYVADSGAERIFVFTTSGTLKTSFGTSGTAAGDFMTPVGVAADLLGNVYVADSGNGSVDKFSPSGSTYVYSHKEGASAPTIFDYTTPISVATDGTDDVYVLDSADNTVTVYPPGY